MDASARDSNDGDSPDTPVDVAAEEQAWDEAMHQALNIARAEGKVPGQVEEGNGEGRPCQHARLAHAAAALHDRRGEERLQLEPPQPALHRLRPLPAPRSARKASRPSPSSSTRRARCPWRRWPSSGPSCARVAAGDPGPRASSCSRSNAAVQDAAEYAPDDLPDEIALKGRGGTDFRPGFEWLDEQGIQPGVCLYFTDMECSSYPEAEPPFDVLWVNYSSPPEDWNREPWGERIDIANNDDAPTPPHRWRSASHAGRPPVARSRPPRHVADRARHG